MVGGGNRRDEASFTVSNTNVFAALDSLRKKKKSDKEKGLSKGGKGTSKTAADEPKAVAKQVFWAPAPLTTKSWADVDDEDDDDYYATTAPPQAIWGGSNKAEETHKPDPIEESESDDDLLDEGDDDVEEEHDDHEQEVQEQPQPVLKKLVEASPAPKEAERQLSKKEKRKKELAELEAILADFGVNPKEKVEDEPSGTKEGQQSNGDSDKKDTNNPLAESKTAKKKKKKDKASKDAKEPQDQPDNSQARNGSDEAVGCGSELAEDAPGIDVKEKLKRMASSKKKKSNKEMDAAARAAAVEAAARSARLAAAKKKEKNHYNQQPMR